jgi:hypothetical protein
MGGKIRAARVDRWMHEVSRNCAVDDHPFVIVISFIYVLFFFCSNSIQCAAQFLSQCETFFRVISDVVEDYDMFFAWLLLVHFQLSQSQAPRPQDRIDEIAVRDAYFSVFALFSLQRLFFYSFFRSLFRLLVSLKLTWHSTILVNILRTSQ